jgi:aerobic-type carbon monoxide dehydrogenase small subunit (CoxS/CutS family)
MSDEPATTNEPAATATLALEVNGKRYGRLDVPEDISLAEVLHEYLGLTGTRVVCGQGVCHACAVIVDDAGGSRLVPACVTPALTLQGRKLRTVEGHAKRDAVGAVVELSPVQQAFIDHYSFQCGFCTPGFVNAATVLVERLRANPVAPADLETTIGEALDPHLCRCTGYVRYYQAVRDLVLATPGLVRDADASAPPAESQ